MRSEEIIKVKQEDIAKLIDSLELKVVRIEGTTTMLCEAFLPNGFSVGSGKSACIDPSIFDYEIGESIAKENALANATNKLWELEGYRLMMSLTQNK